MKLLNKTQINQVNGGTLSGLLQEMHDGAAAGWNKPILSTQMPFPYNLRDVLQQVGNALEGAWGAFSKHFSPAGKSSA